MTKVLTVMPAILMLLWPILGASVSSDYFYNSVMPAAEDRATEKPLNHLPATCLDPSGSSANQGYRTIAYEVNGLSRCGGNLHSGQSSTYWYWILPYNPGARVKIRYATRNTVDPFYNCSNQPMFLWLKAPAMGLNERYLDSGGGWGPFYASFRNGPPTDVWNDLYDDVPPVGDYTLVMGCGTSVVGTPRVGEIRFKIGT